MPSTGRGIPRRALDNDIISPAKLIQALRDGTYLHQKWPSQSPVSHAVAGYGDPTGVTGDINFVHFNGGAPAQASYHILGAGQTIVAPTAGATTGLLDAGLDDIAAEGVEYLFGGYATNKNVLGGTVGSTRGNKVVRLKFELDDASEAAECAVGFRLGEAFEALIDGYNDMVCLNIQAGVVNVETIVGGAATVTTPFPRVSAVADGDVISCEVKMKGGKPTFIFTNHTQEESGTFQVPDAESLVDAVVYVPFAHYLQGAAGCLWSWHEVTAGDVQDDDEDHLF